MAVRSNEEEITDKNDRNIEGDLFQKTNNFTCIP